MPFGVRMRRKGVSRITTAFAVAIIIIIIAVAGFIIFSAGGLGNIGIGTGGNGGGANSNVPAQIVITSTNPTLEQSIAPAGVDLLYYKPLVLQPNTNYTFPITITVENSAGEVLNTSIVITPVNCTFIYPKDNILYYVSPSSGVSPFNATLVIVTGSTVNFGQTTDGDISLSFTLSTAMVKNPNIYNILIANSSYKS
ncbi:MAG: hypothetical protein JRN37_04205 [Nitrososphaerota archaeon]|jgi:hypothetical protein|nr:hypothetical protein [Nitrososphaerota archaeon]MDG7036241.1 hypothetical protein [Nitrososphaerota archaeon]MDG7038349.1 hypothetical protein [Nitrososphaerota archaeon]